MKQFTFFMIAFLMTLNINYAQINLDSCLVAYYPLDSIPIDYSPYSIEGNIINGAYSDTGKNNLPNTAFHFNGIDQYINCGTNQRGITDKVSVSAWIKKTINSSNSVHIVTKYLGGTGTIQRGFHMVLGNGHPMFAGRLGLSGSAGYNMICANEIYVNDGLWHHFLGTVNLNEWNFWVDGNHIGTDIGNTPNPSLVCSDILAIGFYPEVQDYFFNGIIDEVRVYNRVLNNAEISLLSDISFIDTTYFIHQDTQLIVMPQLWSIFSTYITPVHAELDSVLSGIVSNVEIIKDGNGMIFLPQFGVNQIDSLTLGYGYQIKLSTSQTIQVVGTQVYPEV
ncbi:MAG: LamG domain-containing protein, partial [Bacteroidota bacterium]|nr:LamG domain-containing protein [Bacteroidota bacterium]